MSYLVYQIIIQIPLPECSHLQPMHSPYQIDHHPLDDICVIINLPVETRLPSGDGRKQALLVWGLGRVASLA